jgi:macrolide-specific efflux system membrane fusion protein
MQAQTDAAKVANKPEKLASGRKPKRGFFAMVRRHPRKSLLLAVALIAIGWWFVGGDVVPEARPLIVTIEVGDIENAVTAAGTLQPSRFVDVGAQVSGQLKILAVEIGDIVTEGQLVAEIDATVQINRVEGSRASLRALEAQLSARSAGLKLAEANAQRQTRLLAEDATVAADFDSAINSLASAQSSLVQLQSQIAQSKASLASDEAQLGYTSIFAPTDGTVVSVDKKEGQTLNANQQTPVIMRIADLSTMTVEAQVSEADVTKLTPGMMVYFTTLGSSGRRWYGKLRQILPTPVVNNGVVLYTGLFDVDNGDGVLLSSMTAQVFFVTASATNVVKVPVGALSYGEETGGTSAAAQQFDNGGRPTGGRGGEVGSGAGEGPAAGRGEGRGSSRFEGLSDAQREEMRAQFIARRAEEQAQGNPRREEPGDQATVAYVQVVLDDGETERREVRIGVTTRIAAEVLSGLKEGDQVVAGILQSSAEPQGQGGGFRVR